MNVHSVKTSGERRKEILISTTLRVFALWLNFLNHTQARTELSGPSGSRCYLPSGGFSV